MDLLNDWWILKSVNTCMFANDTLDNFEDYELVTVTREYRYETKAKTNF